MSDAVVYLPTLTAVTILASIPVLYFFNLANLLLNGFHLILGAIGYLTFIPLTRLSTAENQDATFSAKNSEKVSWVLIRCFFLLMSIATVILVFRSVRPQIYFVLMIIGYLIISSQLFIKGERNLNTILFQLVFIHLHLVFSLSLRYHYYFGNTDTLPHAGNSLNVVNSHGISGIKGIYNSFPLWHVLTAENHIIVDLGQPIWTTMFLIGGCTGIVAILGSYSLISRVSSRYNIPLFTALLVSASPTVLFYSAYSIPRSVMIGFIPLSLLALVRSHNIRFVFILILFLFTTVLYHPATPPFLIIVLVGLAAVSLMNRANNSHFYSRIVLLATIISVGYWLYQSPRLLKALGGLLIASTSTGTIRATAPETTTLELFDRLYYAPILMFVLIGIRSILSNRSRINNSQIVFGALGFVFFFIAAPGPLDLIAALLENFSFSRWRTYLFPFILLTAAIGLLEILKSDRSRAKFICIIILIILFTPTLMGSQVASDNPAFETDRGDVYFTESEIIAFDRILWFSDQTVYTDVRHRKRYRVDSKIRQTSPLRYVSDTNSLAIGPDGVGIYRYSEASERSLLLQTESGPQTQVTGNDLKSPDGRFNYIYDSGSVYGFTRKN